MQSKITIEIDFDNGNLPVIQILARTSDDVRDKLIQSFLQSLQHTSRWCTIEYQVKSEEDFSSTERWQIKPMTVKEIPSEIKLMEATLK